MRFKHPDGHTVFLGYVTSAHPAPDVAGICAGLDNVASVVRRKLDTPTLGVTLVIPQPAAAQLDSDPAAMRALSDTLRRNRLEVTGMHGVPVRMYDPRRRYGVFRPDWAEVERLEHTLRLARILARLLPDEAPFGVVSTIPFYWRTRHDTQTQAAARAALSRLSDALCDQANELGRTVRVAMEPEPGCAVETVERAVEWLDPDLCTRGADEVNPWIGICADACHMAVQFEDAGRVLEKAWKAPARPLKLQLASGLKVPDPLSHYEWLSQFVDPGRLHQSREQRTDGRVYGVDDLSAALPGGLPGDSEWRIHYHMPIYLEDRTTQGYLREVLEKMVNAPQPIAHMETETYTWPMLPHALRPKGDDWIAEGLARELAWTRDQLVALGLQAL